VELPVRHPAGGVFAALAAGDTVILAGAETVLTAWLLASCIWEAGIPADVVQFLP
jgi:RHH-type proline utilization regulon transcriptional repressor/proline dehydrogenase/delta 1-pyrroline-5-carboxylate dehydrogenase